MTRFTIPDMDCQGCVNSITRAVQAKDSSAKIYADLNTHVVEITSTLDTQTLTGVIDDAGFTVQAA
jgi:copper chaperone CopZ